jgi:hypothetical protein
MKHKKINLTDYFLYFSSGMILSLLEHHPEQFTKPFNVNYTRYAKGEPWGGKGGGVSAKEDDPPAY